MHYVIGDIHNDNRKLCGILRQISFGTKDHVYLLGDLFDRGGEDADPAGVYFTILELGERCTVVRGNHDQWLADYIRHYTSFSDEERWKCQPYTYNSFKLLQQRLTSADLLQLADFISGLSLQAKLEWEQKKYLFAHAMTFPPGNWKKRGYYLMGGLDSDRFVRDGFPGYVSFCGHHPTSHFAGFPGRYLDEENTSIWSNEKGNVYMMDCGCGFTNGKLACMCLESGERFYEEDIV